MPNDFVAPLNMATHSVRMLTDAIERLIRRVELNTEVIRLASKDPEIDRLIVEEQRKRVIHNGLGES